MNSTFYSECASKNFFTYSLEDGFVCDFAIFKMAENSKHCNLSVFISLLFSHHFTILKTDSKLNCWYHIEKKVHKIVNFFGNKNNRVDMFEGGGVTKDAEE